MSRYQLDRGARRRRYQSVMKNWRRLRASDPEQRLNQRARRRRLLEELRVLDLEAHDDN